MLKKSDVKRIDADYSKRLRKATRIAVKKVSIEAARAQLEAERDCGELVGRGAQSDLIDKCVRWGLTLIETATLLTEVLAYPRNSLARVIGHKTSKANTERRMKSRV